MFVSFALLGDANNTFQDLSIKVTMIKILEFVSLKNFFFFLEIAP